MKKKHLIVVAVVALSASMMMQSCIGSFALYNKVKNWNDHVGDKFVNELVFVAMWILPVYELMVRTPAIWWLAMPRDMPSPT